MKAQDTDTLQRGLSNRHIQLIALGGAVGTGLFLGSAGVMKAAGPSMLLGYAIGGLIVFLIMRQLGEMIVHEPGAGSFSHFAYRYWGNFPGFFSGWNYWVLYILVGMSELTAAGKYAQFWFPELPTWIVAAFFFVLVNALNFAHVRFYGESEFWFAMIKVLAVIGMILVGGYLLLSGKGGPQASITNLWTHGGFFPNGGAGLIAVLPIIMFSFGGLELIGITAAEAKTPEQTIPKAINQVIYRILIFYVGALAVLLSLYPWDQLSLEISSSGNTYGSSPFVKVFSLIGSEAAAHILNIVTLTAALSVYNGTVYCTSRTLYGLAVQGNAPKRLRALSSRGVPVRALVISGGITAFCVLLNYLLPHDALALLMALVVSALVLNWALISYTHLKFRRAIEQQGASTRFKTLFYPLDNWVCILFVSFILIQMLSSSGWEPYLSMFNGEFQKGAEQLLDGLSISVLIIPFWIGFIALCYRLKSRPGKTL